MVKKHLRRKPPATIEFDILDPTLEGAVAGFRFRVSAERFRELELGRHVLEAGGQLSEDYGNQLRPPRLWVEIPNTLEGRRLADHCLLCAPPVLDSLVNLYGPAEERFFDCLDQLPADRYGIEPVLAEARQRLRERARARGWEWPSGEVALAAEIGAESPQEALQVLRIRKRRFEIDLATWGRAASEEKRAEFCQLTGLSVEDLAAYCAGETQLVDK